MPGGTDTFLTLEATTIRVEWYRKVEEALFTALGRWARDTDDARVKLFFARAARRHGRNATEWGAVAPRVAFGPAPRPSPDRLAVVLDGLAAPAPRLAAYVEAANNLAGRYREHCDRCSPIGDAAFAPVLEGCTASSREMATVAGELLQAVPRTPPSEHEAGSAVAGALGDEWPQTG